VANRSILKWRTRSTIPYRVIELHLVAAFRGASSNVRRRRLDNTTKSNALVRFSLNWVALTRAGPLD